MSKLLIRGGRLIDPSAQTDERADVLVDGGLIEDVGPGLAAGKAKIIEADGLVVTPGFVDMHVHLREPGREDEETIESGSKAAAAGGFTAVCAMPNTDPVCDNAAVAEKVFRQGRSVGLCDVLPAGAITKGLGGEHLASIGEMATSAARVRLFTDDGRGVQDARLLTRAMEYIRAFDGICAEHCEDETLSAGGQMHDGEYSDMLGLKGIPAEAEEIALARDLSLAKMTGSRFHALHVSTRGGVELIRRAKADGVRVTAEVTPHHLSLTDADLVSYDPVYKVNPPLRSAADVEAMRQAVVDGTLDAIATDHAPHAAEEKESEFDLAPPGMLGLETALAVLITELVEPGIVTLGRIIEMLSTAPARILGLSSQGGPVAPGATANLTLFDPQERWEVRRREFRSLSRNSPWEGRMLTGRVRMTLFEGKLTFDASALEEAVAV